MENREKWRKLVDKIICCAPTTLAVKGLMMMMMMERFHRRCLRFIFGIKWQDHVSNEEVLKSSSLPSTESILFQVRLRWSGHDTRMEDVCMPKVFIFSELQDGKRDRCAPRKRYKDQLKKQLAQAGIIHQSRQQEASDRDSWRA